MSKNTHIIPNGWSNRCSSSESLSTQSLAVDSTQSKWTSEFGADAEAGVTVATAANPMPEDLDVVEPEGGDTIVLLASELDGDG